MSFLAEKAASVIALVLQLRGALTLLKVLNKGMDFSLGEGSNRILSKVQKSFWSCTHVNSCHNYTLYINLHILLIILCKATSNIHNQENSLKD